MWNTFDLTVVVTVYLALTGAGWGFLIDPLRPATRWVAVVSVVLTGFLTAYLAPDAVLSIPVLVIAFALASWIRDRRWRASLIREPAAPRTPSPPPA